MHSTVNVWDGMVNNLMIVLAMQTLVSAEFIAVQCGTSLHMLSHDWLHSTPVAMRHHLGTNLAAALNEPQDGDFVFVQDSAETLPFALVHISGFAADVGLVYFNLAAISAQLDQ